MSDLFIPRDFGPTYAETIQGLTTGGCPIEPWNTYSNLIFLMLAIHLAITTRCNWKRYPLVVISLPILLIGWIGGTLYHGTRSHSIWLIMDFVPISILSLSAAYSFWHRITQRWILSVSLLVLVALSGRVIGKVFITDRTLRISLGYVSLAMTLLVPLTIILIRKAPKEIWALLVVFVTFSTAIFFRIVDKENLLPMGTHWLWHLFGGGAVWFLMLLVVRLNDYERLGSTEGSIAGGV